MLTCYERCLYLLYPQTCTYSMKMFIFGPYRRVSSVDYICVHVCPTQEGTFQHLCGLHLCSCLPHTGRLIPASLCAYYLCSCLPHTGRRNPASLWTTSVAWQARASPLSATRSWSLPPPASSPWAPPSASSCPSGACSRWERTSSCPPVRASSTSSIRYVLTVNGRLAAVAVAVHS